MDVGRWAKTNNLFDLKFDQSALYVLAAPSAPEEARVEAISRAEGGEYITQSPTSNSPSIRSDSADMGLKHLHCWLMQRHVGCARCRWCREKRG